MKKQLLKLVGLVLPIVFLISCSGGTVPSQETSPGAIAHPDYLRISAGQPRTLDPAMVTDIGSHLYVTNLFSGLLRWDPALKDAQSGQIVAVGHEVFTPKNSKLHQKGEVVSSQVLVSDLAQSIPEPIYNTDGTISYVFEIRDVKFHSGDQREVTAYDLAYSIDRAADPRTTSSAAELYLGNILGVMEMLRADYGATWQGEKLINRVSQNFEDITQVIVDLPGVEVLDKQILRITTDGILPEVFLMKMTYPTSYVVDKFQVEKVRAWTARPNGTGPYRIYKKDVGEIVFVRSDVYYDQEPAIKESHYYTSGGETFASYRAGERDLSGFGVDYAEQVLDEQSVWHQEYFTSQQMSTSYIGFNTTMPPFDDYKVRQAFAIAVDKEAIAEVLLKGLMPVARGILPPDMPGYREGFAGLPFDPEQARRLLAESKYGGPEGLGRIKITTSSGAGGAPDETMQQMLQDWKRNLGVEVELDPRDYARYLTDLQKGNFQMFSLGWIADYPHPENFLDLKFHSDRSAANNTTRYSNLEVDRLLEQARVEADSEKNTQLYQQTESIIVKDTPWMVLFHGRGHVLVKPYICNYVPTTMGISVLRYLRFCD